MTKAEEFKRASQVAAHAGKAKKTATKVGPATAGQRVRAKGRNGSPTSHNEAPTRGKNSSYQLEVAAATSRPSRKSTRKSLNRQKTDSALRITAVNRSVSPSERTQRR